MAVEPQPKLDLAGSHHLLGKDPRRINEGVVLVLDLTDFMTRLRSHCLISLTFASWKPSVFSIFADMGTLLTTGSSSTAKAELFFTLAIPDSSLARSNFGSGSTAISP